jgi:hypothetical protein
LLGMRRKYNVHYCVTISYRDRLVKHCGRGRNAGAAARLGD